MSLVLDASALLAFLNREPGGARVFALMDGAAMSAVNWAEVVQKSIRRGADVDGMREEVVELGLSVEPFTPSQADQVARLWEQTRRNGLSLADRACLALAMEQSARVLTADRVWAELGLDLDIRLLRE